MHELAYSLCVPIVRLCANKAADARVRVLFGFVCVAVKCWCAVCIARLELSVVFLRVVSCCMLFGGGVH